MKPASAARIPSLARNSKPSNSCSRAAASPEPPANLGSTAPPFTIGATTPNSPALANATDVLERLQSLADPSLALLEQILTSEQATESGRIRAALAVLRTVEKTPPGPATHHRPQPRTRSAGH